MTDGPPLLEMRGMAPWKFLFKPVPDGRTVEEETHGAPD